jgi:nucleoside-diphosphate-sugar epimerase
LKVLVTGASGLVGAALVPALTARGHTVRAAARRPLALSASVVAPDQSLSLRRSGTLDGCEAVVHLAARVHVMDDAAADPLAEHRRVNTAGTLHLAEQAVRAGVRRFVFASTAKVLGEASPRGRPFTDADAPAPADPYAISKAEAEHALQRLAAARAMRVACVRPPLVYGPGVGANFLRLMTAIARGRPLPIGAIGNRRSLVYVGNLVAAIIALVEHDRASGPFLVSDGEDLSTPELARRIAAALGTGARLLPVAPSVLRAAAALTGKRGEIERLLGDFALAPTRLGTLGWHAPFDVAHGLADTAAWFRSGAG